MKDTVNAPWWKGGPPIALSADNEGEVRERLADLSQVYSAHLSESYSVWLPLPPSVNAAYKEVRVGRACRRVDSQAKRDWEKAAAIELLEQNLPTFVERRKAHFATQFVVALATWRSDINNRTKLPLDLLTNWLGLDDRYEVSETVQRLPVAGAAEEGVLVRVNVFAV